MSEYEGIVLDLPERDYHAHHSLSSTGARAILESPARFHYGQSHPRADKAAFDLGSAAHSKVLGTGYEIVIIPEDILAENGAVSTKAAKEFVAKTRADGKVPLKRVVAEQVQGMSEAILAHPSARALFEQEGNAEASVFATDPATGVPLRARFDYLAPTTVDLKTTGKEASPSGFARSVANFGYDVQYGQYIDVLEMVTGERREMAFVVGETEPPYLVGVYQLDRDFSDMGVVKARSAREIYAECLATGIWPGYSDDIGFVVPPMYAIYDYQDRFES